MHNSIQVEINVLPSKCVLYHGSNLQTLVVVILYSHTIVHTKLNSFCQNSVETEEDLTTNSVYPVLGSDSRANVTPWTEPNTSSNVVNILPDIT